MHLIHELQQKSNLLNIQQYILVKKQKHQVIIIIWICLKTNNFLVKIILNKNNKINNKIINKGIYKVNSFLHIQKIEMVFYI